MAIERTYPDNTVVYREMRTENRMVDTYNGKAIVATAILATLFVGALLYHLASIGKLTGHSFGPQIWSDISLGASIFLPFAALIAACCIPAGKKNREFQVFDEIQIIDLKNHLKVDEYFYSSFEQQYYYKNEQELSSSNEKPNQRNKINSQKLFQRIENPEYLARPLVLDKGNACTPIKPGDVGSKEWDLETESYRQATKIHENQQRLEKRNIEYGVD